jgi:hypothetical protein
MTCTRAAWALAALAAMIPLVACGNTTSTRVRLVNTSPDSNGLEVLLDTNTSAAVSGVTFGTASKYVSLSAGGHTVQVKDPNAGSAPPSQNLNFAAGTDTTLLAASSYATLNIVQLADNNKAPATGDVKIRVVHTAQSLGSVDVYIVAPGTNLQSVSATFSNVGFEAATDYHEVSAGNYEVYITQPGQKFYYIDSGPLNLTAGQIRTVVALDNVAGNGYTAAVLADVN